MSRGLCGFIKFWRWSIKFWRGLAWIVVGANLGAGLKYHGARSKIFELLKKSTSSRPKVFCKKGVFRYFSKFTTKHLCQGLFFNKVAVLNPATLLKKRLWRRCFLMMRFAKFLKKYFLTEHLRRLFLEINSTGMRICLN